MPRKNAWAGFASQRPSGVASKKRRRRQADRVRTVTAQTRANARRTARHKRMVEREKKWLVAAGLADEKVE